jgi:hypothetical protein
VKSPNSSRRCMNELFASLAQRRRHHVARAFDIGSPLPLLVAAPEADVAGDVENRIDVLGHDTLKRDCVLDRPLHKADGIFLQLRQSGVGSMEGDHIPARLRKVLDEVETDKARAARDESGFVRHDYALMFHGGNSERAGQRHGPNEWSVAILVYPNWFIEISLSTGPDLAHHKSERGLALCLLLAQSGPWVGRQHYLQLICEFARVTSLDD